MLLVVWWLCSSPLCPSSPLTPNAAAFGSTMKLGFSLFETNPSTAIAALLKSPSLTLKRNFLNFQLSFTSCQCAMIIIIIIICVLVHPTSSKIAIKFWWIIRNNVTRKQTSSKCSISLYFYYSHFHHHHRLKGPLIIGLIILLSSQAQSVVQWVDGFTAQPLFRDVREIKSRCSWGSDWWSEATRRPDLSQKAQDWWGFGLWRVKKSST